MLLFIVWFCMRIELDVGLRRFRKVSSVVDLLVLLLFNKV